MLEYLLDLWQTMHVAYKIRLEGLQGLVEDRGDDEEEEGYGLTKAK